MVISGCVSRSRKRTCLAASRSVMSGGVTITNSGRPARDYETLPARSEGMIHLVMTDLIL